MLASVAACSPGGKPSGRGGHCSLGTQFRWEKRSLPSGLVAGDLSFIGPCAGIAAATKTGPNPVGSIQWTVDGGQHWSNAHLPSGLTEINEVSLAPGGVGAAIGATASAQTVFLETTDGGRRWRALQPPGPIRSLQGVRATATEAWVTGTSVLERGLLLRKPFGSDRWERLPLPPDVLDIVGIAVTSRCRSGCGFAVGRSSSSAVIGSVERGRFIRERRFSGSSQLQVVDTVDGRHGLAGGFLTEATLGRSQRATLFATANSGREWRPVRIPRGSAVLDVAVWGRRRWVLIAAASGASLILSTDSGRSWIQERLPCKKSCSLESVTATGDRIWVAGASGVFGRASAKS